MNKVKNIQAYPYLAILWIFLCLVISSPSFSQDTVNGKLPEVLQLKDGSKVTTARQWQSKRRPEILQVFKEEMYGQIPVELPEMTFKTLETKTNLYGGLATRKQVRIFLKGKNGTKFTDLLIYYPQKIKKRVPVFLGYNFSGNQSVSLEKEILVTKNWVPAKTKGARNNRATEDSRGAEENDWPIQTILLKGYALATLYSGDIAPDHEKGSEEGVQEMYPDLKNRPDNFGTLAAWAWGLSRVTDYLEEDPFIDSGKIIVIGTSRMGKATLWAGAMDTRFAITISNESGAGGAKLFHHVGGENTKNLCKRFPYWFCENFQKYNGLDTLLPFDQHMLISLIAPRPVYIASADGSTVTDSYGEFLSAKYADAVYKLLNTEGLLVDQFPPVEKPSFGTIGYHLRSGGHGINLYDWQQYIQFADVQLKKTRKTVRTNKCKK